MWPDKQNVKPQGRYMAEFGPYATSMNKLMAKSLTDYKNQVDRQQRHMQYEFNRQRGKIFDHFKDVVKDTTSSYAGVLLKQVEQRSRSRVRSSPAPSSGKMSNYDSKIFPDIEKETSIEEEATIRHINRKITDMLIENLKQAEVDVANMKETEFAAPTSINNRTLASSASLKKRLSLLSSSSPEMAQKRLSLLKVKPVLYTHKLDIDELEDLSSDFLVHLNELKAANKYSCDDKSDEDNGTLCESNEESSSIKSNETTTQSQAPSVQGSNPDKKEDCKTCTRNVSKSKGNSKQMSVPKIWKP